VVVFQWPCGTAPSNRWPRRQRPRRRASITCGRRSPPIFLGATLPLSRQRRDRLLTELGATPKRAATTRSAPPSATAPTIRWRKSIDRGLVMAVSQQQDLPRILSQSTTFGNPSPIKK
jgi:hypothetical protein